MIKTAITQGRLTEAEQYLASIRNSLTTGSDATTATLDALLAAVRAQMAANVAKRDAALDALVAETAAKFIARAPAAEFDGFLQRLATLPGQISYNDPSGQKAEMARTFITRCQDFVIQSGAGATDQMANALNELIQLSSRLPAIPRSQLVALQADMSKYSSAATDAAAARLSALRQRVESTIDSAKSAGDFDALITELAKPTTEASRNSGNPTSVASQMETLRRFVHRWQDYFSLLESNNGTNAQNVLRELSNDNSFENFYPRSRILARLNGGSAKPVVVEPTPAALEPLLAPDAVTIDTLEKFARQISARRGSNFNAQADFSSMNDVLQEANRLNNAANQLNLGNPAPAIALPRMQNSVARVDAYTTAFARVQQTIVIRALPLYVRASADLKPTDTETPDAYLQRVVLRARETKDWQLAFRALEVGQTMRLQYSGGSTNSEVEAYRQFFTAMNQERAGQWTAAARSYLTALKTDSPSVPAEEIGVRLKALKESHPKEYESAEAPVYPVNMGLYPPGYYPGRILPDGTVIGSVAPAQTINGRPTPLPAPPPEKTAPAPAATAPVGPASGPEKSPSASPKP